MGEIVGSIDVAQVVLYVFWVFFAGLVFYLRQEDRREGYPLLSEPSGHPENNGVIFIPEKKTFKLPHGGTVSKPDGTIDARPVKATPVEPWAGAPFAPTGDPMLDAVGPASYAERSDKPDLTFDGHAKIVPLRVSTHHFVEARETDPRGLDVLGGDGKVAGKVRELWVDRSETLIRYLEIDVAGATPPRTALVPINFAKIDSTRKLVKVAALYAKHFAKIPALKSPDQVTLLEEDKIVGYFGGGLLYADIKRTESLL